MLRAPATHASPAPGAIVPGEMPASREILQGRPDSYCTGLDAQGGVQITKSAPIRLARHPRPYQPLWAPRLPTLGV